MAGFFRDILESTKENINARLDEAAIEERIIGIEKATAALLEAKVEKKKIINLLQKYWDLRLSEANNFYDKVIDSCDETSQR